MADTLPVKDEAPETLQPQGFLVAEAGLEPATFGL